jgi:class 3 adenylate cyclase
VSDSPAQITTLWSDILLHCVAELRNCHQQHSEDLSPESIEDFSHLFDATARLEALLANDKEDGDNRHDLMNALAAIRGYAEMLQEDLGGKIETLNETFSRLLDAINTASSGDSVAPSSGDQMVIASEPGFILAVDDLQENRELVARYLSRTGHIVVTAASGEEALRTLEQTDVDVVLLDLIMPGMDGREVLHKIKENAEWRATPVIMISGRQDMEGIIDCIEAGADDYLFKPFNPVLLQARIKAGIERKRWQDREQQYRLQLERNEKFIRGDLRKVTIMMSDIRGFTALCERLAPDQVVKMLNRYLGAMTDIIMAHNGTIDEFIGDAILAVFGAPQKRDDDADRAVQCALAMQQAMTEINATNLGEGLPEIATGIALHTGDVIAGNIGSERRSKYGFVGHPMNLTARIEEVTAGGETLISQSTLSALQGQYLTGEQRELNAKGIDQAIIVYPILGQKK